MMRIKNVQQTVVDVLNGFAIALNAADTERLSAFFTSDAVFMPEAAKAFSVAALLHLSGGFLKKTAFYRQFAVKDIQTGGHYAFVQANATAATLNRAGGSTSVKRPRNFFVLQNEEQHWKIYRYRFNNTIQ